MHARRLLVTIFIHIAPVLCVRKLYNLSPMLVKWYLRRSIYHTICQNLSYKFDKRHFSSVSTANAGFDNPRIAAVSALKIHSDFAH